MRERTPSQTAAFVALLRAVADHGYTHVANFHDVYAERMLPRGWSLGLRVVRGAFAVMPPDARAKVQLNLDVVARRVSAIDAELEQALSEGLRQVVILGAGLDTRTFRLGALHDADVFEIDHPASQQFKRRKAQGLPVLARALHFVAVDFERQRLDLPLTAAGHQAARPTFWLWEGVVMYLSDAALSGTLADVSALSAPGSRLIVNYHEPSTSRPAASWIRRWTRWVGEPQIGLRSRDQMRQAVERAGFHVLRDTLVDETARVSRLLVAQKAAASS